jgi:hypothetical protein
MSKYAFTFGCGQKHANCYVVIEGSFDESRKRMFEMYGPEWSFQYEYDDNFLEIANKWRWREI